MSTEFHSSSPSAELTQHDGLKSSFQSFISRILDIASTACNLFAHGLLGFLLSPVDYILLSGGVAFVPLVHPGEQPVQAQAWAVWKWNMEMFLRQTADINSFRSLFISVLSFDLLAILTDPVTGMRGLTLADIYEQACFKYGVLTIADIAANDAILSIPFVDDGTTPMRTFVATQRKAHSVAAANGQPFPEATKVRRLKLAVSICGAFTTCMALFEAELPTVAAQTFALLAARLESYDDNRTGTVTAGTLNYAAAAVHQPDAATIAAALAPLMVPLLAPLVAAAVVNNGAPRNGGTRPQQSGATRVVAPLLYCYSHGQCAHSGADCGDKFRAGHRDDATLARPHGGETRVWTEVKRALRLQQSGRSK
jgi:hypothetical protein